MISALTGGEGLRRSLGGNTSKEGEAPTGMKGRGVKPNEETLGLHMHLQKCRWVKEKKEANYAIR